MSKILLVEDNEMNRDMLCRRLERKGYDVIVAFDGAQGMSMAQSQSPDLILMDIQLPEVSGLDVIRWIKNDQSIHDIPIIAVTAFAMKGDEERIREGGCEAYLSKPISVGKFIETIRHFLGSA